MPTVEFNDNVEWECELVSYILAPFVQLSTLLFLRQLYFSTSAAICVGFAYTYSQLPECLVTMNSDTNGFPKYHRRDCHSSGPLVFLTTYV